MHSYGLTRVFLVFLLILASSFLVKADTLSVGLGELDYPPFYYSADKALTGATIEIAEAVASRAGYQLNYNRVPWKRLQEMLRVGSLDMVVLYFKTTERAKDVVYTSEPHIYENSSVVVPKGLKIDYSGDIRALVKHDIFYVRGYSHGKAFDTSKALTKHSVNNEKELLKRVTSGRPFLGVGNKPALMMHARKLGLAHRIEFLEPPFDHGENYMAFSKKRPDARRLAEQFSLAFSVFSETSEYEEILKKYGFSSP